MEYGVKNKGQNVLTVFNGLFWLELVEIVLNSIRCDFLAYIAMPMHYHAPACERACSEWGRDYIQFNARL